MRPWSHSDLTTTPWRVICFLIHFFLLSFLVHHSRLLGALARLYFHSWDSCQGNQGHCMLCTYSWGSVNPHNTTFNPKGSLDTWTDDYRQTGSLCQTALPQKVGSWLSENWVWTAHNDAAEVSHHPLMLKPTINSLSVATHYDVWTCN